MTFYEWAMKRRITNTPRGDFLTDLRSDERAPTVANTKEAWESNLRGWGACEGARFAFRSLWGSYCAQYGDPQKTEAIREQRANLFFEIATTQLSAKDKS